MASSALLTDEMRAATRKIHSVSDQLVNVKLLVALTKQEMYGRALLLFYYIYAQIEVSLLACKDHEALKGLQDILPSFARRDAIAKDLHHYLGPDWNTKYQPPAAVTAYVKRIKELETQNPTLLVPYCYHMYMALLAGGQMIKKLVNKSFDLPAGAGLHVFDFDVKSRSTLRSSFKEKINAIPVNAETKKLILAESVRVFKMNNEVVRSLEGSFRQFVLWLMKWTIVFSLIYWTYTLFVKGTPSFT